MKFSCHPPAAAAPSALPAADFWPGEFQGLWILESYCRTVKMLENSDKK